MNRTSEWRSYEATAMWWSFAVVLLLLTDVTIARIAGVACLVVAASMRWHEVRRKPVLAAYLLFSIAVLAADEYGGRALRVATVDITGWLATEPYLSILLFGVVALLSARNLGRIVLLAMLGASLGFPVHEWLSVWPRVSDNPYLAISVWRPVWTVAVPLTWVALLLVELRAEPQRHAILQPS